MLKQDMRFEVRLERPSAFGWPRLRNWMGALPLLLELVFNADGESKIHIELLVVGVIVDAVMGHHRVWRNAKHPVSRAIQIHVSADDGGKGDLIVIEIDS